MYFIRCGNCCNYWTIDEYNINIRHKKAETFTCKGFDILSANSNYWTIDEYNINNNRERERISNALDLGTKAEWMLYRYFICKKADIYYKIREQTGLETKPLLLNYAKKGIFVIATDS